MGRRTDRYLVRITHSCHPDERAVEVGLNMWAAFLAENRRRRARQSEQRLQSPSDKAE